MSRLRALWLAVRGAWLLALDVGRMMIWPEG
jgi:hypothetical protein